MTGTSIPWASEMDMEGTVLPSGRQVELSYRDSRAVVVTAGGGLRTLTLDGVAVVDGYGPDEMCNGGRGQVLVPWPNRVRDGKWTWAGLDLQLGLSEAKLGNASHGLVRWLDWSVLESSSAAATLGVELPPHPGYPFRLSIRTSYALGADGLTVTLSVHNGSAVPAPVGLGMHPYLTAGTALVDDTELSFGAGTRLVMDERQLPVGEEPATGWDGPIGEAVLDTCFGGLRRDADGLARIVLTGPDRVVTMWLDETWKWAQIFTGDTLGADRRRQGIAVEPMSCPADALRSGRDLVTVGPGDTLSGCWGVAVSRHS